jgi:hypothetical protein
MNQEWVQKELGVPLNFSISFNALVNTYFGVTGDPFKVSIDTLNEVVAGGIKVALVFGDRDYRCNCKWRDVLLQPFMQSNNELLLTMDRARRRSSQSCDIPHIVVELPRRRLRIHLYRFLTRWRSAPTQQDILLARLRCRP